MAKQILPHEIGHIVLGLLVSPSLFGNFDQQQHQSFMLDIGRVVADHCGGEANWINGPDIKDNYLSTTYSSPTLSISPNEYLPCLSDNVWSHYDPDGWVEDGPVGSFSNSTNNEVSSTAWERSRFLILNNVLKKCLETGDLDIYSVVALSTAHITIEDRDMLETASGNSGEQMILSRETGFFLKLYEDLDVGESYAEYSDAFRRVVEWAHNRSFRMIEFKYEH